MSDPIRKFETGATRDTDSGKLEYEGFFSPLVLKRRAEYMHEHRRQADGSLRAPDNWQLGIPTAVYISSLIRHTVGELWVAWREGVRDGKAIEDTLCAILFNAEGLLLEILKAKRDQPIPGDSKITIQSNKRRYIK